MKRLFKTLFYLVLFISFSFFFTAKAQDIEDLERQLEKQELEEELNNFDDNIDDIELNRELEILNNNKHRNRCKTIVKTKTIYKTIPANCNNVENYYLIRKYSVYDILTVNKDSLKLTNEQLRLINLIHRKIEDKILDKKARINLTRKKLDGFIKVGNMTGVRSALIEIGRLKIEISLLDIIEYKKSMEVLTEEQKKLLHKLIEW